MDLRLARARAARSHAARTVHGVGVFVPAVAAGAVRGGPLGMIRPAPVDHQLELVQLAQRPQGADLGAGPVLAVRACRTLERSSAPAISGILVAALVAALLGFLLEVS